MLGLHSPRSHPLSEEVCPVRWLGGGGRRVLVLRVPYLARVCSRSQAWWRKPGLATTTRERERSGLQGKQGKAPCRT